jgi:hypothetical protein
VTKKVVIVFIAFIAPLQRFYQSLLTLIAFIKFSVAKAQGIDELVVKRFGLDVPVADLSRWEKLLYQS